MCDMYSQKEAFTPFVNSYLCLIEVVLVVDTDQLGRVRATRSCHLKDILSQIKLFTTFLCAADMITEESSS